MHGHDHGHVHAVTPEEYTPRVRKVLIVTLVLNESVAVAKITWGYLTGSLGMMSDGFHSLFDGVSNVVGLVGIWIASHPPDEEHPYGHKKFENLFTIIISLMIFGTCFQILKRVYHSFTVGHETVAPNMSFVILLCTMAVNAFVMFYEMKRGRQLGSDFLVADALHTKSDIFASFAVMVGLLFTRLGYPMADAIAGIVITVFIARIGYEIIKSASDVLVDTVCIDTNAIEAVVAEVEGVKGCHGIRTRGTPQHVYLDLHIQVDPEISIRKAHDIAHHVEDRLLHDFPNLADIVAHVEPALAGLHKPYIEVELKRK
ncbi:MAG: cation diffusion facilitator family transporter [Nitrospirota bacterium]